MGRYGSYSKIVLILKFHTMYYLLPLSLRDILFSEGVLEKCEESKKYNGYYIPENIYLILKNKDLC